MESAEATTIEVGKKMNITAADLPIIKESVEGVSRDKGTACPYPVFGYGAANYE